MVLGISMATIPPPLHVSENPFSFWAIWAPQTLTPTIDPITLAWQGQMCAHAHLQPTVWGRSGLSRSVLQELCGSELVLSPRGTF